MYMSISERLQMVIKMNGMTNAAFADKVGVQRSSISHVLAGRNKPSIDFIQKTLNTFPKVNADWLITGKKIGRTIDDSQQVESMEAESTSKEQPQVREEEPRRYNNAPVTDLPETSSNTLSKTKKISRIVVFYEDGTFETSLPRN
ncbi:XRE family transcriptional regulator [Brumimicrobium aurantiacum]|uniref:XRE family transcriptional regulator n=2 Tax=Brumimicrobium aurantiacum TaxID=1737063 RepID=A0A3E1EZX4_9FLAO|nr:XRE family transcriptional regulator [Brumimicrobium aurantiacum]